MRVSDFRPLWPLSRHKKWMDPKFRKDLVSVIIPSHNREVMLIEAMNSIWEQTYRPLEVIIDDDGSTDGTKNRVQRWFRTNAQNNFILKYYYQDNQGVSSARNRGLIESTGEYIQYLDSDDLLHRDKIAEQVRVLQDNSQADYVYAIAMKIDAMGKAAGIVGRPIKGKQSDWIASYTWHTCSPLYRRQVCFCIGPWDEEYTGGGDDLINDAKIKICGFYGIFIKRALSYWRLHKGIQLTKRPRLYSARVSEKLVFSISRYIKVMRISSQTLDNVFARYLVRAAIIFYAEGKPDDQNRCLDNALRLAHGRLRILAIIASILLKIFPVRFIEFIFYLQRFINRKGP